MTFSLLGRGGIKNDCLFPLSNRALGIGTDPNSCAIIYPKETVGVAEFHCQLAPQNDGWTLTDFSEAGTWLNGKKMTKFQAYPLKVGDVFYIVSAENSFCLRGEESTAQNNSENIQSEFNVQPGITQQVPPQNQSQKFQPQGQLQINTPSTMSKWDSVKEKFLTWEGRLNRKPYILRSLAVGATSWVIQFIVAFILALSGASEDTILYVSSLPALPLMIPSVMLGIRRMHDTDHSGWWLLIGLVPIIGWIYSLYLLWFKKGTPGSNRFGADPLA